MAMLTDQQINVVEGAFQRGWRTLLREERVTARNIETISASLLKGILLAVQAGEQNEIVIMAAGLQAAYESPSLVLQHGSEGSALQ
jgi:hypothetical protein